MNWVIRSSQPTGVMQFSSQHPSAWTFTWLWMNSVQRSGLSPVARSIAATERVLRRSMFGILGHRDGVQIDNAEEVLLLVLPLGPALHRAQVIAEVKLARRLYAAENPLPLPPAPPRSDPPVSRPSLSSYYSLPSFPRTTLVPALTSVVPAKAGTHPRRGDPLLPPEGED